jgi:hypothetical protein
MKLEELSIEKLKSLAYDELVKLEQAQGNIRALNQAITQKLNSEKIETKPKQEVNNERNNKKSNGRGKEELHTNSGSS